MNIAAIIRTQLSTKLRFSIMYLRNKKIYLKIEIFRHRKNIC